MSKGSLAKLLLAAGMLILAGVISIRWFQAETGPSETAYFYDLSEKKLFVAPLSAVPPIPGMDGGEEDGVRAVVVSTTGNPNDESSFQIAYLEMYSPEFKAQIQANRTGEETETRIGRSEARSHSFVKRLEDSAWYPLNSDEAERILTEWQKPGPGGQIPIVCVP